MEETAPASMEDNEASISIWEEWSYDKSNQSGSYWSSDDSNNPDLQPNIFTISIVPDSKIMDATLITSLYYPLGTKLTEFKTNIIGGQCAEDYKPYSFTLNDSFEITASLMFNDEENKRKTAPWEEATIQEWYYYTGITIKPAQDGISFEALKHLN